MLSGSNEFFEDVSIDSIKHTVEEENLEAMPEAIYFDQEERDKIVPIIVDETPPIFVDKPEQNVFSSDDSGWQIQKTADTILNKRFPHFKAVRRNSRPNQPSSLKFPNFGEIDDDQKKQPNTKQSISRFDRKAFVKPPQ